MKKKFLKILAVSSLLLAGGGVIAMHQMHDGIVSANAAVGDQVTVAIFNTGDAIPSTYVNKQIGTTNENVSFMTENVTEGTKNGATGLNFTYSKSPKLKFKISKYFSLSKINFTYGSGGKRTVSVTDATNKVYGSIDLSSAKSPKDNSFELTGAVGGETEYTLTINKDSLVFSKLEFVLTQTANIQAITTFDANTGSFADNQLTYTCTQTGTEDVTKPADPKKEGYTFKGWSATQGGTEAVTTYAWNTTYYAIWNINSYAVSFISDGVTIDTKNVNHGEKATATDKVPTKEGNYDFAGWDYDFNQPITSPTEINAIWKEYFYIEVNGAQEKVYNENSTYTLPELDSEGANLFKGWTTVQGGTTVEYNAGQVVDVTAESKFYPVYENVGTITVNFMDGTSVLSSQEITKNTPVDVPASDPTKEGYRFDGWKKEDGSNFDFTVDLAENTNVYASWNKQVTVTFEGATVVDNNVYYETDKVAKPADPTKENYVFDGWYNGNELYDFNSELKGDITITAHWKNYVYTQIAVNGVKDSTVITPVSDELSFYKTVEHETNGGKNVSKITTENGVWDFPYSSSSDAFIVNHALSGEVYVPTGSSQADKSIKCESTNDEYNYQPNTKVNTIKNGSEFTFYVTQRKGKNFSNTSFDIIFVNGTDEKTVNAACTLKETTDYTVNKCTTIINEDIPFESIKIKRSGNAVCVQAITFDYEKEEGGLDLSASKYSLRFTEEVEASVLEGKESVELSSYYKIDNGEFTKVETSTINVSSLKVLENGRYELSLLIFNLPVEVLNHSITVYFEVDGVKSAERTVTIKELAQVYKNDHSGQLTEFELNLLDELLK